MRYFEIFGLEPQIKVDQSLLKRKFIALSKAFHPDFFTLEDVEKQMEAMEQSAELNKAYNTLKEEAALIKYVLDERQMLSREANEKMPADFLMEMLELHEKIDQVKSEDDEHLKEALQGEINNLAKIFASPVNALLEKHLSDFESEEWEMLKQFYLKLRYIRRLSQQLANETEL